MDTEKARALIAQGEGQRIEFKQSFAEENKAIESLCAFTHADGGIVFFGVKNSGDIVGVQLGNNTLENLANKTRKNTQPPLTPWIETLEVDGQVIVAVTVEKARPDQLIYAFNTPYTRVGKTNQVMNSEQQRVRLSPPKRLELPSCFQPAADAFAALIPRNFLFEFAGPDTDYLQLLSTDLRRLFFRMFNKHLRSGIINRMIISGSEGSGKTFNTLLLSLQLSREGYEVFYCHDIRVSSLTPDHLRTVTTREHKSAILIIDNSQNDVVKAENLAAAISQVGPYTARRLFLFLTHPLDTDTFLDTFGANTPVLVMRDKLIDFDNLVRLFFQKRGMPESAAAFLEGKSVVRLPSFLFKYRNMAFWNEVLRSLLEGPSQSLTEEQILMRAHSFFRRKEQHLLASREPLACLLPFFSRGIAVRREYACEIIGERAEEVLRQLEERGFIQVVEQDWETNQYEDTSALVVASRLHPTKAKLLIHVFSKYYGYSMDPTQAIADYAERFLHNLYYHLASSYYDPDDLRLLFSNPKICATTRRYFLERHLGKKLDRVIQRLALLAEETRDTLFDKPVMEAFAGQFNGERAYLVSKTNLFRAVYRVSPKKAYDLFCLLSPEGVTRSFLPDDYRRSGARSLAKLMEVFKNVYYYAPTPDAKEQVQLYVKRVIDECREEFVRRIETRDPFFTQIHWMLKRLHGLKLAPYFLEAIAPERLIELIRTKDTNIVELSKSVLLDARYASWTEPGGSQRRYYDIMRDKLTYEDLKRVFDNKRSDLYDLVINASHDFVAKALVRYADEPNFTRKAAAESLLLRDRSVRLIRSNFHLTEEEREKVATAIVQTGHG